MHLAAFEGHAVSLMMLLDKGGDLNAKDNVSHSYSHNSTLYAILWTKKGTLFKMKILSKSKTIVALCMIRGATCCSMQRLVVGTSRWWSCFWREALTSMLLTMYVRVHVPHNCEKVQGLMWSVYFWKTCDTIVILIVEMFQFVSRTGRRLCIMRMEQL